MDHPSIVVLETPTRRRALAMREKATMGTPIIPGTTPTYPRKLNTLVTNGVAPTFVGLLGTVQLVLAVSVVGTNIVIDSRLSASSSG